MRPPDWQTEDGSIRLFCGDCLDILPELEAGSVDCFVTSPKYNTLTNVAATGMWGQSTGGVGFVESWAKNGYDDDMEEHDYIREQHKVFEAAFECASSTASLFYNHKLRWRDGECSHPVKWFAPRGWTLRQEIIWDKAGGMMHNARMFVGFDERILWFDVGGRHKWNQSCTAFGSIWRIARLQQQQGKVHPVQFPLEIPERCILATTEVGDMVCDPYSGSATTGVACIRLGRKFIGIEKERKYFDIAVKRITDELGKLRLFDPPPKIVQRSLLDDGKQGDA